MTLERILKFISLMGLLFLVFLAGIVAAIEKNYFYWKVQEIYLYREASELESRLAKEQRINELYFTPRTNSSGVTIYDQSKSQPDYTLYTDATSSAHLMDMQGRVIHTWHLPYQDISPANTDDLKDMYWRDVKLLPDGSLLAIYEHARQLPYGAELIKVDKNSKLIWKSPEKFHHSLDVAPDGKIYALMQTTDEDSPYDYRDVKKPYLHDHVAVLSPNGEILKRVSILKALQKSGYNDALKAIDAGSKKIGDLTHSNSVFYVTPEMAAVFSHAKAGDILLSIRNISAVAVLNIDEEKITWLKTGAWEFQHDASVLPNGNIAMFDNLGAHTDSSRVIEYNPAGDVIGWSYNGNEKHPFYSNIRGKAQYLDNDNFLITDSAEGRIFEVTHGGEIVWEFYNPLRSGPHNEFTSILNSGRRYHIQYLPFLEEHE